MASHKGTKEYKKWQEGKPLTRKEAILCHCYICNGFEDSNVDCLAKKSCPLYAFAPYRSM